MSILQINKVIPIEGLFCATEQDTHRAGLDIGSALGNPITMSLTGPLGAGKTVFVRGLAEGLGCEPTQVSSPTFAPFRAIYMNYLMRALPFIARKTSSNPDAYIYLADSIRAWPDQKALASQIVDAGWTQVGWKNLTGGVVAIHMAVAP